MWYYYFRIEVFIVEVKKLSKNGFTLVELLSVMVILISISLVSVVGITSSLKKREGKEGEEQIALAIDAAKIYFSLEEDSDMCVAIRYLVDNEYITDRDKVSTLDLDYKIKLDNNQYKYQSEC